MPRKGEASTRPSTRGASGEARPWRAASATLRWARITRGESSSRNGATPSRNTWASPAVSTSKSPTSPERRRIDRDGNGRTNRRKFPAHETPGPRDATTRCARRSHGRSTGAARDRTRDREKRPDARGGPPAMLGWVGSWTGRVSWIAWSLEIPWLYLLAAADGPCRRSNRAVKPMRDEPDRRAR